MKCLAVVAAVSLFITGTALPQEKPATVENKAGVVENVTPDQAERVMKENKDAVILDIRTSDEFKEGHIAGAKNVDFLADDFAEKVAKLDPSKPIVLHCASGGRSTRALEKLKDAKLTKIYHLDGGFAAWKEAGKPVQK